MSVTLWVDDSKAVGLGETFGCYAAFAEIAHAVGEDYAQRFPDLFDVLTLSEDNEPAGPRTDKIKDEAAAVLKAHGDLSDDAKSILSTLASL